jgi:hypothetical protein
VAIVAGFIVLSLLSTSVSASLPFVIGGGHRLFASFIWLFLFHHALNPPPLSPLFFALLLVFFFFFSFSSSSFFLFWVPLHFHHWSLWNRPRFASFVVFFLDRPAHNMALVESNSLQSCSRASSLNTSRKTGWGTPIPPPSQTLASSRVPGDSLDNVELSSYLDGLHIEGIEVWDTLNSIAAMGNAIDDDNYSSSLNNSAPFPCLQYSACSPDDHESNGSRVKTKGAFYRWMKTLHHRARQRSRENGEDRITSHQFPDEGDDSSRPCGHRKMSSASSSFRFVTAVKSANISFASMSGVTRSRRNTARSRAYSRTDRSSKASVRTSRLSEDSGFPEKSFVADPAAISRSLQRRRILEELIHTEEGYIGDIRFLINVGGIPRSINVYC